MKLHLIFIFALLLDLAYAQSTIKWAKNIGSPDSEAPSSITSDNLGNVYLTGTYSNSLVICNDTLPQVIQPLTSNGTSNIFISKFDSLGNCIWTRVGVSSIAMINSGAISPTISDAKYYKGYLYCIGSFTDKMIFGNDTLLNPTCSTYCTSAFIIKFDSLGNTIWYKCFKGGTQTSYSSVTNVIPYEDGIFISGTYIGSIISDTIQLNAPNMSTSNGYIIKLNHSGKSKWGKNIGTTYSGTTLNNLVYDQKSNLYMQGTYRDSVVFPTKTLKTNIPVWASATFIIKADTLGNINWIKGGVTDIGGDFSGQKLIFYKNYLYFTGMVVDSIRLGTNTLTITPLIAKDAIVKFDTSGNFLWFKTTGNKKSSYAFESYIDVNENGLVLFSNFIDTVVVNNDTIISNPGYQDMLLSQYDHNGNSIWNKIIGGSYYEFASKIHCKESTIYIGAFSYSNFSINTFNIINHGAGDVLFVKFHSNLETIFINEINTNKNSFLLFPNPNRGNFIVKKLTPFLDDIFLIYNNLGSVIFSGQLGSTEIIDLKHVPSGLYHIRIISSNNTTYYSNFIIE